jgi:hypothetical protein
MDKMDTLFLSGYLSVQRARPQGDVVASRSADTRIPVMGNGTEKVDGLSTYIDATISPGMPMTRRPR